jgi:tetratricopeptide (TPR) repeat protein
MLISFSVLFLASAAIMVAILWRRMEEARTVVILKHSISPGAVPVSATVNAAAAQAGNIFLSLTEKLLRRVKVSVMKFDNVSTRWIHRLREWSRRCSMNYRDWRIQKHGLPKISFESSFVTDIEEWFEGFFQRYFRRGVGLDRTALRDDLEAREKVLVASILANPKDINAYKDLGLFYFEKGNLPDALSAFEAIRKIDPTNSDAADRVRHIKEVLGATEKVVP